MTFRYKANTDWRTSKSNIAPDLHLVSSDVTPQQKRQLREIVERDYAGARVVGDATATYNCHAYAHARRHAWFNEIQRFIEDDYYPFTPGILRNGDIVVYVAGGHITHSGVITRLSGNSISEIRSKWGAWPEVLHAPQVVPDEYGSITYYLRERGTRGVTEDEPSEEQLNERVEDLLSSLTREERLARLALASTPTAARVIAAQFPEMAELVLYGSRSGQAIHRRLMIAEHYELAVLAYATEVLGYMDALPALATKVAALADDGTADVSEALLLSAFETLNTADAAKRRASSVETARKMRDQR